MYTKFFGSFLLNRGIITSEQLIEVLKLQSTSHIKLGALAMHAGLMTGSEVEEVFIMQTHKDKRFGELAVSEGYLTQDQVNKLLSMQTPDFLLIGQNLVEQNIITSAQLQNLITDYQSEYEIVDLDLLDEQKETIHDLIQNFYLFEDILSAEYVTQYINLLFTNLTRFIGTDFTPLNLIQVPECPTDICVIQKIKGDFNILTAIELEKEPALSFTSRYLKEEENSLKAEELTEESLADYLNLLNGLFSVNMSNDRTLDLNLDPPEVLDDSMLSTGKTCYMIPIVYSFGTVHFILSIL